MLQQRPSSSTLHYNKCNLAVISDAGVELAAKRRNFGGLGLIDEDGYETCE